MKPLLTLLGALLLVIFVIYLSFLFSRFLANSASKLGSARHITVIDRLMLGQDRLILIVKIGEKFYLLGSSEGSVTLLTELSPEDIPDAELSRKEPDAPPAWKDAFQTVLKEKLTNKK